MELRHFRYFLALTKHLNFTRAAQAVHVTQSTLSHQIGQLEHELGHRLFIRKGRSVALTEAGQYLVPGVTRALDTLDEVVRGLKGDVAGGQSEVQFLLGTRAFGAGLLPACLGAVASRHPGICVSVEEVPSGKVLELMQSGRFDLGVGDRPPADSELRFEPLYSEELVVAVSSAHPLAGRRRIRMTELHRQAIAVPGKSVPVRKVLDQCFRAAGVQPHIVAELNQPERLAELADNSEICVIVTRNLSRMPPGLSKITLEDPTPVRTLGFLWKPGAQESLAVRLFAEIVRETLRAQWRKSSPWQPTRGHPAPDIHTS